MEDIDSTLVRRGRRASSLADMVAFTQSVHERPIGRLLEELPALASLSETKFNLATKVLRHRIMIQAPSDQEGTRALGTRVADAVTNPWVADRIRSIFNVQEP